MNIGGPSKPIVKQISSRNKQQVVYQLVTGKCELNEREFENLEKHSNSILRINSLTRKINLYYDFKSFFEIIYAIKKFKPDIVHTHLSKAGLLGRLAAKFSGIRPKIIHTYHGQIIDGYFSKLKVLVFLYLERLASRITDVFISVSHQTMFDLKSSKVGLDKKWLVLHPGVSPRKKTGFKPNKKNILWVGRFEKIKNPMLALMTFKVLTQQLKNSSKLVMIGDGDLLEECKEFAKSHNLNVAFLGWQSNVDFYYEKAALLLMTSLNEGLGLVAIEAGNHGVPTVSTRSGGISDYIISSKNGYLVDSDPIKIAKCLSKVLNSNQLQRELGKSAYDKTTKEFNLNNYIKKQEHLYKSLLKQR